MRTKHRSLLAILFLNIITLGIYQLYWYFITKTEMNTINGSQYRVPFFLWFFIPIINIWWFWRFAKAIEKTTKGLIGRWAAFLAPVVLAALVSILFGVSGTFNIQTSTLADATFWWKVVGANLVILLPVFYYQHSLNKVAR